MKVVQEWPGHPTFPLEVVSPYYIPTEIPPGFMFRHFSWPSLEKLTEAVYKIGKSEIAFEVMGFNPGMIASNIAANNVENRQLLEEFTRLVQEPGSVVIIAANSSRDLNIRHMCYNKSWKKREVNLWNQLKRTSAITPVRFGAV